MLPMEVFHCMVVYPTLLCYMSGMLILATAQQTITVPNQNWKLVDYLCGSQTSQIVNQTTLELSPSEEHVIPPNLFCVFLNKDHVVLQSSGPEMAVISCEGSGTAESGLGFVLVDHLTVSNIIFENCGGIILHNSLGLPAAKLAPPKSSLENAIHLNQQAVLLLSFCTNVSIINSTFNNYRGYAIYAINVYGDIKLQHITITNSYAFRNDIRSSNRMDLLESGSGVYFHFIDMDTSLPMTYSNINITDNSTLSNNWNVYPTFLLENLRSIRLQNLPEDFPLSGGAALSVHLEQRHFKVKLGIDNMETRNSVASSAGSVKIISRNTINNFDINITRCAFVGSGIFKYGSYFEGAGIQMFFDFSYDKLRDVTETAGREKSSITICDSVFERNSARVGAALAVFSEAQNVSEIEVHLKSILFTENEASDDGDCIAAQCEQSAYYQAKALVLTLESIVVVHIGSATNIDVDRSAALSFVNLVTRINGTVLHPTVISNGNSSAIRAYDTKLFLLRDVHFIKKLCPPWRSYCT